MKARMSPPRVEKQVPRTNDFQRISISGPDPLWRCPQGFVLLVHVATELGLISKKRFQSS